MLLFKRGDVNFKCVIKMHDRRCSINRALCMLVIHSQIQIEYKKIQKSQEVHGRGREKERKRREDNRESYFVLLF